MLRIALIASALCAGFIVSSCEKSESTPCGDSGVVCPAGWVCIADLSSCIDPTLTTCGDGVQDDGEACDDGNLLNHDTCNYDCTVPRCGDGFIDTVGGVLERCDDGDVESGNGCNAQCSSTEFCGDGVTNDYGHGENNALFEECDDGVNDVATNTPRCDRDCTFAVCGDGFVNNQNNDEQCDGGNPDAPPQALNTATCTDTCQTSTCGDGFKNPVNEQCDLGSLCEDNLTACASSDDCVGIGTGTCAHRDLPCCTKQCLNPLCGDSVVQLTCGPRTGEVCDNGSRCADGASCTIDAQCATVAGADKACAPRPGDGCNENCDSAEVCGDGIENVTEVCDLGSFCADKVTECTDDADCAGMTGPDPDTGDPKDTDCKPRNFIGCLNDCKSEGACGDEILNNYPPYDEICDDGMHCENGNPCTTTADCGGGSCAARSGDGCNNICTSTEQCGNGQLEGTEECDYGADNNGTDFIPPLPAPQVRCSRTCAINDCGNRRFDSGEGCDNGTSCTDGTTCTSADTCTGIGDGSCKARNGDGCSDVCAVEIGWTCPDVLLGDPDDPCEPVCGDFLVRGGESCDDNNEIVGDGCSLSCQEEAGFDCPTFAGFGGPCGPVCGDGTKSGDEQCDDNDLASGGVLTDGDGCNRSCDIEVGWICPNGLTCTGDCGDSLRRGLETCDNGKHCSDGSECTTNANCAGIGNGLCVTRSNDGCTSTCQAESGWTCFGATPGPGGVCLENCGDGDTVGDEVCDDGDKVGGDGCDPNCRVETGWDCPELGGACTAICNDGLVQAAGGESCDEGNATPSGGCNQCAAVIGWTCPPSGGLCKPTCGDGRVLGIETCDDLNQSGGDGCSGLCQQEVGWTCPTANGDGGNCTPLCDDGLLRGVETCDEGPLVNTGGCVSCQRQEGWTCATANQACTEICGDDLQVGTEGCDDGPLNSNNADCTLACVAATCNDVYTRSQTNVAGGPIETDLNCGVGPGGAGQCPLCPSGKRCLSNSDCLTNFCNPVGSVCAVPGRQPDELRMHVDDTEPLEVPVSLLLDNDNQELIGAFSVSTASCGGVSYDSDGQTVTFDPAEGTPCVPPSSAATIYKATFTYTVCPTEGASPVLCSAPTLVTVVINRDPTLVFPSSCVAVGTTSTTVNVLGAYSDPDGNPLDDESIVPSSDDDGTASANGSVVSWEPFDPDIAAEYQVSINACDNVSTPPFEDAVGCDTATWTVRWSDAPKVTSYGDSDAVPLLVSTTRVIPAYGAGTHVIDDTPSNVTIGAARFANGPTFGSTAVTSLGGSCTVNQGTAAPGDESISFLAGSTPGTDSCFVQVCESCSGIQICSVTRLPFKVIRAPVANDDSMTALNGPPAAGTIPRATLLANDTDATGAFSLLNSGATTCGGTVTNAATLTYAGPAAPSPACLAQDSFSYRVCSVDIPAQCDDANVTIVIGRFPVAVADSVTTPEDTALVIPAATLLANDSDPDNDTLTITAVGSPTNGTVQLVGTTITFTPTPLNFNGSGSFTYTVSDGKTLSSTALVTVAISPVNDAPVITSGSSATIAENATIATVVHQATATDVDAGDTIVWSLTGTDAAAFNISATGAVTLKVSANFETKASYAVNVVATDSGTLTATRAVTVTVTPVNEAPTVTSGAAATVAERAPISTVIYTATATDPDAGDTIVWSLTGADAAAFDIAANGSLTLKASADFETKPFYSINVVATDSGTLTATRAVTVTVTDVNDPPVVATDSRTTAEDTAVVMTNASLLANDTDADLPANTLTIIGVGSPVNGSVAQGGTSVTFTPALNFSGTASFTYTISDGAGGTATGTVTVTVNGANDAPVLDASKNPSLTAVDEDTVTPTGAVGTLVSALVDLASEAGGLDNVSDVDATPAPVTGIAITAADTTNGTWRFSINGGTSWATIGTVAEGTARLLAADTQTRLHFQPNANFNGSAAITFRAWDTTSGSNGATASTTVNGGITAFSAVTDDATVAVTAQNDAPVLDDKTPVLAAVAEDAPVPTGTVGTLVSSLVDFALPSGQVDNVTDPDTGALLGIAITAIEETNGNWFFSVNGGGAWTSFSSVTAANALLLNPSARVYFRPNPNFAGTATLTFRAWDQFSGANGTFASTATNGGLTAFSTATDTAVVTVTPSNDAPTLDNLKSPALAAVPENAPAPSGAVGTLVSALVDLTSTAGGLDNVTDSDAGAVTGMAISAVVTTNGTWFYTINGGSNWATLSGVSGTSARLLPADANTRVYFQPNTGFNGSATLTFRAWDTTSGAPGELADPSVNGAGTAFSAQTDTASASVDAVNDAPVLVPLATPTLAAQNEDSGVPSGAVGTLVSSLVDLASDPGGLDNVIDLDAGAVTGIAVTAAVTTNGTWHFSTNNGGAWSALGAVANNNARLLAADASTRIYFQPNANFSGSSSITFRAWDTTDGANGGQSNTSPNGNSSSFSTLTDDATVTITPVPDSPTATGKDAPDSYNEDGGTQALTNIVVADVDSNDVTATLTLSDTAAGVLTTGTFGTVTSTFSTGVWSASGVIADVNAALAAVAFTPASNFTADFTIAVNVNDATSAATTGTKAMTGNEENDAPVLTAPASYSASIQELRGAGFAIHSAGWSFVDLDATASDILQLTFDSAIVTDEFEYDQEGALDVTTLVTPSGDVVVRGTLTQLTALLAGTGDDRIYFTSDANAPGPITVTLSDLGVTGTGGIKTDVETIPVNLTGAIQSQSAGNQYGCAVSDGELFCWGDNTYGQIGDGTTTLRPTPVKVGSGTNWTAVAAGYVHACGLRGTGELWCWGRNNAGQVGDGTTTGPVTAPVQIGSNTDWTSLSAGGDFTCGTRATGTLWCWGDNTFGSAGSGLIGTNVLAPTQVGTDTGWSGVATGRNHGCGLRAGGLYCWGRGSAGQLGDGTSANRTAVGQVGSLTTWTAVAGGDGHTCAIRGGELFCWGVNDRGQLGNGTVLPTLTPVQVGAATNWATVSAGFVATCGTRAGALYCWGGNEDGQVGDGTAVDKNAPVAIGPATGWTATDNGQVHTCGVRNQELYCWGSSINGQLGDGGQGRPFPTPLRVGLDSDWTTVRVGASGCGLRAGALYCWGRNVSGEVGDGTLRPRPSPTQVGSATTWNAITVGGAPHVCGINGTALFCWGGDLSGQLGNGATNNAQNPTPSAVTTPAAWTAVAAGGEHACGLSGGGLYCWGGNGVGQLGLGDLTQRNSPVQVGTEINWIAVAGGGAHACGIRGTTTGSLWCWGLNDAGQLGLGNINNQNAPVQVGTDTDWSFVQAGSRHTCGLRAGALYCWGENAEGNLGDGTQSERRSPTQIGVATTWTRVGGGLAHSGGVRAGLLFGWGRNVRGQVGDGTTVMRLSPTQIGTATNWTAFSAGGDSSCGVSGGALYCWGDNAGFQLGVGAPWTPASPVVLP